MSPSGFTASVDGDGIAVLTIDRPEKRNALTHAMWRALPEVLVELADDPRVRVLLLTGAGGTFSAGADIAEFHAVYADPDLADAYHTAIIAAEEALAAFPHPTVAVVEGASVGGGCQLAAACDLRFAAADARFGVTPAKLGVVYPPGPTARLTRLLGPARAAYLLYSAELIPAERAEAFGLVDEVCADVRTRALEFARTVASRSPQTLGAAKAVIAAVAGGGDAAAAAAPWERVSRSSPDALEGLAAFLERRPARFRWQHPGPAAGTES